ncbi:MAG: PspA/IM30 family protein [Synechococcaceae cyanobacterium SM2_3_2]|nr:PspA/IM30 family protein [Synechococcaceae cyanobacterium SM2_3_2]
MGIFDRVGRIVRSNLNSIVSAAEDPEKILNQTITDMSEDLVQLRQAVATAIASQKRIERQYEQAQQNTDEWQRRAELAIRNNDENLAREALVRKKTFAETAQSLKRQLDEQSKQVDLLKINMTKLESKISEAKTKKDMLIARARSAKASKQINEVIGKVNVNNTFTAFERMEDKVNSLEAQSAAMAELSTDTLETKFAALEVGGSDVDSELALLKASINEPSALPSGSKPAPIADPMPEDPNSSVIDDELDALKREIDQL